MTHCHRRDSSLAVATFGLYDPYDELPGACVAVPRPPRSVTLFGHTGITKARYMVSQLLSLRRSRHHLNLLPFIHHHQGTFELVLTGTTERRPVFVKQLAGTGPAASRRQYLYLSSKGKWKVTGDERRIGKV